ncbi:Rne/Rng family ribonuclease [Candidatus Poribacteria bacterium]|jgi:ribonuclease G|nr:Rne/Rng family ribonuclease [Candidatus Poribacteria bacterium]MBT5536038.1 Rne/Rng family ribonuclease [Candidatus Poribacteria bacterium]MBT5709400.1 Rne/Rng family ribonuclease [Candidatus Poribacteria bacterium]MBT7096243.1 Rne/Rng family ribonuclease [Candidatus Poribacteria bacterium]MBT7807984.1 Rne/Rng family ribonuclease [Candidatus Poribacteria bacterium]
MATDIVVSEDAYEIRVAIMEDGRCAELFHERKSEERILGHIYKGKVGSVLPGMQAAFVDIGTAKNAFLHVSDLQAHVNEFGEIAHNVEGNSRAARSRVPIETILKKGQELLVQIDKEPIGTKGPRVTGYITMPGRYLVYIPTSSNLGISRRIDRERERTRLREALSKHMPKTGGIIVRTACAGLPEDQFVPEIKFLLKTWEDALARSERVRAPALVHEDLGLVFRIIRDVFTEDVNQLIVESASLHGQVMNYIDQSLPGLRDKVVLYGHSTPAFDHYGIEQEVQKAMSRRVWLKSGGYLVIDETEALIAIDVNTGKFVGASSHEETIYQNNLEAAVEIARQIRLRDLGGIIVLDFIDMESPSNRKHVLQTLEREIRKDKARTNILQFTELGIVEMTRQRTKESLSSMFCTSCPYCNGAGYILSEETIVIRVLRGIRSAFERVPKASYRIVLSDRIAARLNREDRQRFNALTRELKIRVALDANPDLHLEDFRIFEVPSNREVFIH